MYDRKRPNKRVSLFVNSNFVGGFLNRETTLNRITLDAPNSEKIKMNKNIVSIFNILFFSFF
jgi:hypothetical protein